MKTFYTNLSGILQKIALSILSILGFAHIASAQCPVGQSEVTIDVTADQWGYECYWELVPGGNNCGTGFIFQGGNPNVGCNGGGVMGATTGSGYANNSTTTEGPWCLTNGSTYDIKSIDDWGDGGSVFKIYVGGSLLFTFTASMGVQTFSFTMPMGNNNNLALSAISFQTDLVSGNTPDSTAALYYYQIPLCQAQSDTIEFWGTVTNSGTSTQTKAYVTATVTGAQSFAGSSDTLASLAASASADMMVTKTYTPAVNGTHNVVFTVASDSTDQLPANNTVAFSFDVTDTVYARDNDAPTSAYYFPTLMQYQMGNLYRMNVADTATSISMFSYWQLGSIFILHLYDGSLTTPVASSPYTTITSAQAGWNWITLPFDGGSFPLVAGDYIAAFEAVSDTVYFAASGSAEPTPPVTTFIYDGTSWGYYDVTTFIRLNVKGCAATTSCTMTSTASATKDTCNAGVGDATAVANGGTAPYTYLWNDPVPAQSTATATGLVAGTYSVTVTDAASCTSISTATVTNVSTNLAISGVTSNDDTCQASVGSATVSTTGGSAPITYLWSPGGKTTATATGLSQGSYNVTVTDKYGCSATSTATVGNNSGTLTIDSVVTNNESGCGTGDGSATVFASKGVSPYNYIWTTSDTTASVDSLSFGMYGVTVSDSYNCFVSYDNVFINSTGAPLLSVSNKTDVLCYGDSSGSATVSITGGTAPYGYLWNTGLSGTTTVSSIATGLAAGVYSVTVSGFDTCLALISVTITQPAALVDSASSTSSCSGSNGTAGVFASGGTAPYSYLWSVNAASQTTPIATGLSTGTFTYTLTDANGCSATDSVTVGSGTGFTLTDSTGSVTCNAGNNGIAKVTANGGTTPFSYLWGANTGSQTTQMATGLLANTFSVTVTDANGCTATASVTVTEPNAITISPAIISSSITLTVTGGNSPYGYNWSPNVGTGSTVTGLVAGSYNVTVTDLKGCTKTGGPYLVVGINELGFNVEIHVVPNPTNGKFTLTMDGVKKDSYTLEIRNIIGQLISTENLNLTGNFSKAYDLSKFNKGVYLMNVKSSKGERTEKIVIY